MAYHEKLMPDQTVTRYTDSLDCEEYIKNWLVVSISNHAQFLYRKIVQYAQKMWERNGRADLLLGKRGLFLP